jgi:HSP20 family protein
LSGALASKVLIRLSQAGQFFPVAGGLRPLSFALAWGCAIRRRGTSPAKVTQLNQTKDKIMTLLRYTYPRANNFVRSFGRSPWSGLETQLDRLFTSTLGDFSPAAPGSEHRFPVDLFEDKENTYVRAELPGLARENINIEMVDGYLTINAERKETDDDGKVTSSVALNRSLAISDTVQTEKVSASYENGVLTVTLPKREEAKPRKVTIDIK